MNSIRFLILGVGGNVSQGIITALKNSNFPSYLVGGCISPDSAGLYECDKAYISPYADDPNFIEWVISICKSEKIEFILTGVEEIIVALANNKEALCRQCDAIFISSMPEQLSIGGDKLETCMWLKENNCNYPVFSKAEDLENINSLVEEVGFPLIAKPRKGKGSQGILKLEKSEDLQNLKDLENYVVEECIGTIEDEYTVGLYYDKNSCHQGTIVMHRYLEHGTTVKATVVKNSIIEEEAKKIGDAFKPVGPLNVQMRLCGNKAVCFELNVRFSGTTPMRAKFGFNDVESMVNEYLFDKNIDNTLVPKIGGMSFRTLHEIFTTEKRYKNLLNFKETII